MNDKGMFKTTCACGCGSPVFAYATDKMGTLPRVFVDKTHEGNYRHDKKKFDKRFV